MSAGKANDMSSKRFPFSGQPADPASKPLGLNYATAGALVATALLVRFLLAPVFGTGHPYTVFYPVVLLTAYGLGVRPALMAMGLSALLAYWMFVPPPFAPKAEAGALAGLGFFLLNCSTAIYLITGLKRSLENLASGQDRAEALAHSHADLFRELSERVTNHMQLVSGLLALQAQGEQDDALSGALTRASERTLLIARIHREFAGQGGDLVDFHAFAAALLAGAAAEQGAAVPDLEPGRLMLPRDQATSLGVALLECVNALSRRSPDARLRVRLTSEGDTARFRISRIDGRTGVSTTSLDGAFLLNAMVNQLGGQLRLAADQEGSGLELSFPRHGAAARQATSTYH